MTSKFTLFFAIAVIFISVSCKSNDTDSGFRSYGDYDLVLPTDANSSQLTKSSRIYGFTSQKNGNVHQITGKDFNVNFNFLVNTDNLTLNTGSVLFVDKALTKDTANILLANLKVKSYDTTASSSEIMISFDRYFTGSMTTNTSTSTITKEGSFKLKIAE